MMMHNTWRVLLSVAFILLVFCAVRALRRPAASVAAPRPVAGADRTPTVDAKATDDLQLRQLETAEDAQQIEQQEAAAELQRRQ